MVEESESPTQGIPIEGSEIPAAAPAEPGTEAEGVEPTETTEVTQEAPLVEEAPPAGQVPGVALEYKPRSDIYTLILIFTFMIFTTVAVLAGIEGHDYYDAEFYLFGKDTQEEAARKRAEAGGGAESAPAPTQTPPAAPTGAPPAPPAPPPGGGTPPK